MKYSYTFEAQSSPDPRRDWEAILFAYAEALQNGDLHAQDELRRLAEQQPDATVLLPLLDALEEEWGASLANGESDVNGSNGANPSS